eukprot:PITA_05675
MWKELTGLFQNRSDHRKLALKDKLKKIKMEKGDSILKYLTKFTQCWDELGSIEVTIAEEDLVSLTILGLPKSWHSYQDLVNRREKLPEWDQLWFDLVQEEIQQNTRDGSPSKNDDEENCALAGKAKKGKRKTSHSKRIAVGKNPLGGVEGEALASQFELDITHIACMVSSMMGSVWYLDSGASFHMSNNKELFSNLEDKDLQMHIEMEDDGKYSVTSISIVTFQRESGSPHILRDVMYVPGLKKNLVFVSMLEDNGYDVIFSKGKALLRHIATG